MSFLAAVAAGGTDLDLQTALEFTSDFAFLELIHRWVVWEFCPQEGACEIPVPKWSDQGDSLLKKPLNFENSNT